MKSTRSSGASLVAQTAKNLPAMQETSSIPESGRSLKKGVSPHSIILAWRISWTEELCNL